MSTRRGDEVKFSQHDFKSLMNDYSNMAVETKNKRLAAKCANVCLQQVVTGVTRGDDDKILCYREDNDYLNIVRRCLEVK